MRISDLKHTFSLPQAIICLLLILRIASPARAQVNAEQVMTIGRNVLSMDDYMLSIQYFNQAIKAKPYLADPYYFRALAKLSLEDYSGAEEDCTLALERNKYKTETYKARGFARQFLGKDSLAIEDYNIGLSHNPDDKYFLFYKSVAQTEIGDYDGADSTFRTLLRIYPRFDEGHAALGRLNLLRGDTVGALASLNRATELAPNSPRAFLMRAEVEFSNRDWQGALSDMDRAITLEPREADLYVNRAYVRYNLEDWFGAMADYNYAIELAPDNSRALFNRALLRYEVKDLNRAAADFTEVLRLDPDNFHAMFNLGLVDLERGKPREALRQFDRIAARYPRFHQAYYARAEALRDIGDMRGAMQSVHQGDELVKRYVKDPEHNPLDRPTIQPGRTHSDNGRDADSGEESEEEIMSRFNQLVTVGNTGSPELSFNERIKGRVQDRDVTIDPETFYMVSFVATPRSLKAGSNYFRHLDEFNSRGFIADRLYLTPYPGTPGDEATLEALFALSDNYGRSSLTPSPRPADLLASGIARALLKDFDAAERDLSAAIDALPDFTVGYMARGAMRQSRAKTDPGFLEGAIKDYDQALQLDPTLSYALFNKGNIYYETGDYTSALECYTRAMDIDPQFGQAAFNRGLTYLRLGRKAQALSDLRKAGEMGVIPAYSLLKKMK